MENTDNVHRCCFRWEIYYPFKTWRKQHAIFHHGSPTVTQWKATLQPLDRGNSYWDFAFSLEFDEWFKHRYEIAADAVIVDIELNGKIIRRKEVRPCYFCKANWYTYQLLASAVMLPQMKPHHLVIKIEISLPGRDVGNGLFFNEVDLTGLSRDLKKLLNKQEIFNMLLQSKNHTEPVKVLSYIIDARWNNFFTLPKEDVTPTEGDQSVKPKPSEVKPTPKDAKPEDGTQKLIEVEISHRLLLDILNYIYSGILSISWPDWQNSDERNAAYIAELFRVIDKYKIYDLHKAFVNDLKRERVTRNHTHIERCLFQLNIVNGEPIKDSYYVWNINSNPECDLIFTIRVSKDDQNLPWLSYSILTKSTGIYVEVNLEIVKKVKGNAFLKVDNAEFLFYGQDHLLLQNTSQNLDQVLFLGCPEICGDNDSESGTEIQYFIQCFLNVSNGVTADQFRGVHIDTSQSDLERLSVLSNDMYKLKMRKEDKDCKLQSRFKKGQNVYLYCLHDGILKARVPKIHRVIHEKKDEEFPPFHNTLSHKTISFVLNYIYTGKVFPISEDLFHEADYFGITADFTSLLDLLQRIRSLDE